MDNYLKELFSLYFPDMNERHITKLIESINPLPKLPLIEFDKNQRIYSKGQAVRSMFLLKSGLVRVYDQFDNLDNNAGLDISLLRQGVFKVY